LPAYRRRLTAYLMPGTPEMKLRQLIKFRSPARHAKRLICYRPVSNRRRLTMSWF
jgi:hypothetical protein